MASWYAKQALSALILFGTVYVLFQTGVKTGSVYFLYGAGVAQGAGIGISGGILTSLAFLAVGKFLKEERCSST